MAPKNGLPGSVDIINQKTGDIVMEYPQNADRVVNLSQTSIVRVNASPASVNFYEREGNDLIVHMKDGSTVRYQRFFFLDENGLHSELVFEDDLGAHHAVFPFAADAGPMTAEAIVPAMSEVAVDSLIGAGGISALAVLGGLAAVGGIVGIAAASGGGGGGGGGDNDNNNGGTTPPDGGGTTPPDGGGTTPPDGGGTTPPDGGGTTPPDGGGTTPPDGGGTTPPDGGGSTPGTSTLTVEPLAEDNLLNQLLVARNQVLSGSTEAANAGSVITIMWDDNVWTTTVNPDGSWAFMFPPEVLQSLSQGPGTLRVRLLDFRGRTVETSMDVMVDTVPPALDTVPFVPNQVFDSSQLGGDKILRGFADAADEGSTVLITLNGNNYFAIVDSNGNWQTTIPLADLQALSDGESYTISYEITDLAGNVTTGSSDFTVNLTAPAISVNPLTGDDVLNSAEIQLDQTLSGNTQNIAAGQTVTITLGGQTWYAVVQGDGSWSVTLPSGDLLALANGSNTITVSVVDKNNQTITSNHPITVDNAQTGIAIAIVSTDDYLNAAEVTQPLEVRGVTTVFGPAVSVLVEFNGKVYDAVVDNAGNWSAVIPAEDLAELKDGPREITATVTLGTQTASDEHILNVAVNHVPQPSLNTPFADGILSAGERDVAQTIAGNTGISGPGQKVSVLLGGKTYTATVDSDGNWAITVPPADLQTLPQGTVSMTVNASDAAGNTATLPGSAIVDTLAPDLAVLPVAGSGRLGLEDMNTAQVLSGISSVEEAGRPVTVVLNNKTYTTTVGSDGNWSVTLPSDDLKLLADGANLATVTLTDAAGNPRVIEQTINVKTTPPTATVTSFAGNNGLDAAEIKTDQLLRGTTTDAEPGSRVVVTLGGNTYQSVVASDGSWTVLIPSGTLYQLTPGENPVQISVTDIYGQTTNSIYPVTVDSAPTAVAISIISGNDYIGVQEAAGVVTINGTSAGLPLNTEVQVLVNGVTYPGFVDANGNWSITLAPGTLSGSADGPLTITASAVVNGVTVSDTHTVNLILNALPQANNDPLFGDGVLNGAEIQQNQTLTGETGVTGPGQTVSVNLGGNTYTGTVNENGQWSVTIPSGALDSLTNTDSPLPVTVTVTDIAGNTATSTPINVNIDVEPPVLSFDPFATNDTLNLAEAGATQTLSGVASGAGADQPVTVVLNGQTYTTTTGANGVWSVDIPSSALQALPDGQATFTVTVTDAAQNSTTASHNISVRIDPQKQPLLTVDPVAGDNVIDAAERGEAITLTGKVLNVEAGQTVTVTQGTSSWTGTVGTDGSWQVTIPPGELAGLLDGDYALSVQVSDSAGNSTSATRPFTVDTTVSSISIAPLTGDDRVSLSDINDASGLVVSGSSVGLAEGTPITVTLNGKLYAGAVGAGGAWSVTVPAEEARAISDGTATLTVSAQDGSGDVVSNSHQFTIVTTTLPTVSMNQPFTDGIVNSSEALTGGTLSGTTGVSGAGQLVQVQIGSGAQAQTLTATVDASGNWSVNVPSTLLNSLTDGTVPVVITATDGVGNAAVLESSILVDKTPPVLTLGDVAGDGTVNAAEAAGPIVLTGTATPYDPAQPQTVVVQINGQTYNALIQANGDWSVTLPAGALSGIPDGPVSMTVIATDSAGNSATIKESFTLDASPVNAPQVTMNSISTDNYVNASEAGSPLVVSGSTVNVEQGQIVTVTLNGVDYPATVQADGSWSVAVPATDLAAVQDGVQPIRVTVTDAAGNVDDATQNVTFITQPGSQPTLSIDSVAGDNVISDPESSGAVAITGVSTNLAQGTLVTVTLAPGGGSYTASIGADGRWSVQVPASVVSGLADQTYTVTATASDAASNPATSTQQVRVDTVGPDINLDPSFLSDGLVNISESAVAQTLSGTTTPGSIVSLTINGTPVETRADQLGQWSIVIPAEELQALPQGPSTLTLTATDPDGNVSSTPLPINVGNTTLPAITIGNTLMLTDGMINTAEATDVGQITGTSSGLPAGATITLFVGAVQIGTASVGSDGNWTATIAPGTFNQFANGPYTITASAADAYANPASGNLGIEVVRAAPDATLPATLFTDGIINQLEASTGQILTGTTGLTGGGQTVAITITGNGLTDPITVNGAVDNNGNWTVQLPSTVLTGLSDGAYSLAVTVTDKAGNSDTSPAQDFDVRAGVLPTPTLDTAFGNGVLISSEVADSTLTGTTGLDKASIQTIQVSINNGPFITITDANIGTNGEWTLPVSAGTLGTLPDGTIPVKIIVTDTAGNIVNGDGNFQAVINNVPEVTLGTLFTDGVLNNSEAAAGQVLTGNTGVIGAGQTVTVTLNGVPYNTGATVDANGQWSVTLPPSALTGLTNGQTQTVVVTVSDAYGNVDSATQTFVPQLALPTPGVTNLFGGDETLNISEAAGPLTLTGSTGLSGGNQFVTVTIDVDGVTYVADVDPAGQWTVSLPAGTLQGLDPATAHTIVVRAEDQYGNVQTAQVPFDVAFTAPTVTVNTPIFGDNYLNISESTAPASLSGTFTSRDPAATTVQVTIGGKIFDATVDPLTNTWTLALDSDSWIGVDRGQQSVIVTITDDAQNTGSTSTPVVIALNQPTISVNAPFGNSDLDWTESQQLQTLTGTTSNVEVGRTITVTLGGQTFTTTVQPGNTWALQLTPLQMATLANGSTTLEATVQDIAGNPATTGPVGVTIDTVPPAFSVTVNPVAGDNIINASEFSAGPAITVNGQSNGYPAGTLLNITVNGVLVGTATVDGNNTWTTSVPVSAFPDQTSYTIEATSQAAPNSTSSVVVQVDTLAPTLTLNPVSGDDIINAAESGQPLTLGGTASLSEAGRTVSVTLNGKTYYAVVGSDGNWSTVVPQADVAALPSGSTPVTAQLSDVAGNPAVDGRILSVQRDEPLLEVNALSVPAVLNTVEAATGMLVAGRGEPGNTVTVTLGPLSWSSTVDSEGNWSHTFPELDLRTLTDGAQVINITSTDAAGNTSSNNVGLNVALNQGLGVLVNDVFGTDGVLNVAESLLTQLVTGQVSGDYRGATVKVTIAGVSATIPTTTVGADGKFSIQLPPDLWTGLTQQTLQLQVDVTDIYGNSTNQIINVGTALTDLPVIGDITVAADNIINLVDSTTSQVVSLGLNNAANVAGVVVTIAGRTIQGTQDALGNWIATLPPSLLGALPDGTVGVAVSVTDKFGNVVNGSTDLTVAVKAQPSIVLDPLFGDGMLSIPELLSGVISGTATGLNGRTLSIKVGDTTAFTTNVDGNGKWSVALPEAVQAALQGLGTGNVAVSVQATDQYGNNAAVGANVALDLLAPVLNAVTLFGDGLLNAADALLTQTITGSVGQAPVGSTVSVQIGTKTFAGVLAGNGTFSINVSPADLASLADGVLTPVITIQTPDGNTTTTNGPAIKVGLTGLPTVSVNTGTLFGGDGYLSRAEADAGQIISGVTSLASGTVTVRVGTATLTGTINNGTWSVNVPPSVLQGLADGNVTVSASVRDDVGNPGTSSQLINAVINVLPSVSLNTPFGDGNLSLSDLLGAQVLNGTTTNLAAGTALTVTLGGLTFNTTVGSDGSWRLPLPTATLQGLTDGTLSVGVTARDVAGNVATDTKNLLVAIQQAPTLVINSLFGDGGLNATDILSAQTITGSATNAVGSLVNVTLGNKVYQALVGSDGNWSVSVPKADLSALLDGTLTVNASLTNPAGNVAGTSGLLNVITHSLPSISLTSLFGNDGFLNVAESNGTQTISGRINGGITDGSRVVVSLGGTSYNATVNQDGSWSLPVSSTVLKGLTGGALKVGVSVIDKVGNTNSTSTDVTVKLTTPELTWNPLATLNPLTLLTKGLTLSGGSRNLGANSVVHLSLLNGTVSTTAITDANGNWSTTLNLGLNILNLLSLTSVVNLYATDAAGNTGYLNVGLGGNIISTTPPATLMAMAVDDSSFVLHSDSINTVQETDSAPASTLTARATATAAATESDSTLNQTEEAAYTIGGVSITLADGTEASGDSVQGSEGNDTIHLATLGFVQIDGGAGTDTLMLDGVDLVLNLIDAATRVHNIEIIDLGKSGTNSITLDLNEALTVTDKPEDDLIIKGSKGDSVNLVHGNSDIWAISGQREVDGMQFDIYHNSSQSNTLGDVLVQQGLHVNMV
ncbi:Ig-like domain-containing protein [Enterobacter sp.]|uniref:Ig-like domain-containing protein n=1 Tax=Enterobacter sp. TaxID=42895 RepID=UPI00296F6542|nr:Ig-like domain-containing protein [Enterobacter sp.]